MAVTANDLKFFASAVMADTTDGGGPRASTLVQNGVLNNLFPSISAANRSAGAVHIRKFWPSITNADRAALLGASLALNERPSDPSVSVAMWRYGDSTTRLAALPRPQALPSGGLLSGYYAYGGTATSGNATVTGLTYHANSTNFDAVAATNYAIVSDRNHYGTVGNPVALPLVAGGRYVMRRVVSRSSGSVTFDKAIPWSGAAFVYFATAVPSTVYGASATTADVTSSDTVVPLADPLVRVLGISEALPHPASAGDSLGMTPIVREGDLVTLYHEAALSSATYANGNTANAGRTNVDQFSVIDNTGAEVLRLLKDGPTSTIASANFATGVLTFNNVSGLSQPLTVRHRIVHDSSAAAVGLGTVTLANAPSRTFASGSVLAARVPLGDLQARAYNAFSQQAWTRAWSDSVIGNPTSTMYAATPVVTNQGAETDRWAIVMTSGNTFDCYSERLGKIGNGNTATDYSPTNPATGAPFFTLAAASWASGLLVGSAFRFNTEGACAPCWALRAIVPGSSASGTDRAVVRLHGSVD